MAVFIWDGIRVIQNLTSILFRAFTLKQLARINSYPLQFRFDLHQKQIEHRLFPVANVLLIVYTCDQFVITFHIQVVSFVLCTVKSSPPSSGSMIQFNQL
jgi:hypothetical protein